MPMHPGFSSNRFKPSRLPEVTGWYAGDRSQKTFNGPSALSQVDDLSSSGNNLSQVSSTNQPVLSAFLLDGINDFLNGQTPSFYGMLSSDYEVFFSIKNSSSTVQFLMASAITNFELHLEESSVTPTFGLRFIPIGAQHSDIGTVGQYTDGNPHIVGGRVESNIGIARADEIDTTDTETPGHSTNDSAVRFGARQTGTGPLSGNVLEIIICNDSLAVLQRSFLETYLNNRMGI